MKDSLTNVEDTGEFVYNMCTADLLDKMVVTSKHSPRSFDEMKEAGLEGVPCEKVRPPRLKDSPIAPADVVATVETNAAWLRETRIPKVFIRGRPGGLIQGQRIDFCRNLPNTREIVVAGIHYIQEDSPDEIGRAIADLVRELGGA